MSALSALMSGAGSLAETLVRLPEKGLTRFASQMKTTLIFGQLLALFLCGFLVAGAFASYFYFESWTLDRGAAALYVAGEFLVLMMITLVTYLAVKPKT